MNCYGTNPMYRQVQNVNTMNQTLPATPAQTQWAVQPQTLPAPLPGQTITSGDWSQPIPVNPNLPTSPASVTADIPASQLPDTLTLPIYTPGYLRMHIGDLMRVEFLIGNSTTDRVGRLKQVGASFIVLTALDGGSEIVCDIYSIRFVTIIRSVVDAQLLASFPNS